MPKKLKVAFFFGAGAEGTGNFGIASGYDYLKSSLLASEYHSGMTDALKTYFQRNKYFKDYTYRADGFRKSSLLKNFLIQKSITNRTFFEKHIRDLSLLLSQDDFDFINKELETSIGRIREENDNQKDKLLNIFDQIITGKTRYYSDISEPLFKNLFSEKNNFISFDMNAGLLGTLDSYFHTIINPSKYGAIYFSRLFNYYWACYFTILKSTLEYLLNNGNNNVQIYFNSDGSLNYIKVLNDLKNVTKWLYDGALSMPVDGTYYGYIKKLLSEHSQYIECRGVATTNYYRWASCITNDIVYLNGQLNLFEYPELLEVVTSPKDLADKKHIFFPFMFGQSLTKPIVHSHQIKTYNKFYNMLEETNVLVVLGYNINEDDNHINSFLHEFVTKGGRLIVVTNSLKCDAFKRLKCSQDKIEICLVEYQETDDIIQLHKNNKNIIKKVFDQILNAENEK